MKTFADVKRRLVEGATLTMVRHDWLPNGKLIGLPRKIIKRQTDAIQFDGGSWLQFPPAKEVRILGDNEFAVQLSPEREPDKLMAYRFN